jgi:FKBP-type peptidyl-prolyl cis-trans isomerase
MNKKYYQSILLFLIVGLLLSLGSCNPARKYEKAEKESIQNYLNRNSADTFDLKPSGLYYHNVLEGTGPTPVLHDTAYVKYVGKFLDGTVFDDNGGKVWTFPVGEGYAIGGFDEGITYMKQGGKATLLLPSSLAFGTQGYYAIGGYTPVLFEVELILVRPGPVK